MITGALAHELVAIAQAVGNAAHGEKETIYQDACARLSLSRATLMRKLARVKISPPRKQRTDAGEYQLSREEAILISAVLMESHRKKDKQLKTIGEAVAMLRANGEVKAERVDPATGEITLLSDSAISRALKGYVLHPKQLLRPAPAKELKSLHPNHVWQIDASLCVLYYLRTDNPSENGLQVMRHDEFYKNKPKNLARIESERVWSYEVTDHYSGAIFVHYVLGAESAKNISESFIEAIQQRDGQPFYGVPEILMMDMGSANTSGIFKNLLRRLNVRPLPHAPKNARATGQVENARNIIERNFESGLKFSQIASLEELNAAARVWANWYNTYKIHSRHGCGRFSKWLEITTEQLRIAPPPEVCQALLTHEPELRRVSDFLTVQFNNAEYDVSAVPRVFVGEKLKVTYNPYKLDCACIVDTDAQGHEVLQDVPLVQRDRTGYRADGNVIGEDYTRHADTIADTNRKEVERVITEAATQAEAEEKRKQIDKGRVQPFGGRIDPFKHMREAPKPAFIPRQGAVVQPAVTVAGITAAPRVLSQFEALRELVRMGMEPGAERAAMVRRLHPDGVPEDQLESLKTRLEAFGQMRVIAGGKD